MSVPICTPLDDESIDRCFPPLVRERSRQFWTPAHVAARAAALFSARGACRILDVGCGPGKFCIVAGCLHPELEVHGVEQRPRLARLGQRLARKLGAGNVQILEGDATELSWEDYDGFYFFNPFAENIFHAPARFDNEVTLSPMRLGAELLRTKSLLESARVGSVVITYHGLGGPIPASYELVAQEAAGSDLLRTWVRRSREERDWSWLEVSKDVVSVPERHLEAVLVALAATGAHAT